MIGVNVPIPVPMRLLQLRRLEAVAVRRPPHARPRGRAASTPAPKVVTTRWPESQDKAHMHFPTAT